MTSPPVTGTPADLVIEAPEAYSDPFLIEARRVQARKALVLDSIRASLEEQPTPRAVRSCTRDWVAELLAIAETVAKNMEHPE